MKVIPPYYRTRLIQNTKNFKTLKELLNSKPFIFGLSDEQIEYLIKQSSLKIWGCHGEMKQLGDNSIVQYNQHIHESPNNLPEQLKYLQMYPFNPDGLIAVDKPSNCVVHPVQRYYEGTIQRQVEKELNVKYNCINRLDKLTSGVLVMGNDYWTQRLKNENWTKDKHYFALVKGLFLPQLDCNDDLIYFYPTRKLVKRYRGASTSFELIRHQNGQSLILAKLRSGFPHQIRIHLRNLHFPIINDPLYGANGKYCEIIKTMDEVNQEYLEVLQTRTNEIEMQKRVEGSKPCSKCLAVQYEVEEPPQMYLHAWKYRWTQGSEILQVHTSLPSWVQKFLSS